MKVAVVGATGVVGSATVRTLLGAGHEVLATARTPEKAASLGALGAVPVPADVFDHGSLVAMFERCDAVCSVATRVPVGLRAGRQAAWRQNDRLHTEGVRRVILAAREAHVRRLVQESVSLLYADQGDAWIDEDSPLDINAATEPACVAEAHVQDYCSDIRQGVVLRFGTLIGNDDLTRFWLRSARHGRAVGLGSPDGWVHPLHTDDIGAAVTAALTAPSGVYNVGAEPVRRSDLVQGYADAVGRKRAALAGPVLQRLLGSRAEPAGRSLRVSSARFRACTGWAPRRPVFDGSWLRGAPVEPGMAR